MRDLIQRLEAASRDGRIVLEPPAGGASPPVGLRELAAFAGGFACPGDLGTEGLRWTGPAESSYLQESPEIPCMEIGHDECGNAWVLLFDPAGQPAQVLFACHDPVMLFVAGETLDAFCAEWIEGRVALERRVDTESRRALARGISREAALASADPALRELAQSLDAQRWLLFDIRRGAPARGFERGESLAVRKHPRELLFAVIADEPSPRKWWRFWR